MKLAEVAVGGVYLTKVGESPVRVEVIGKTERRGRTAFLVRRVGENRPLPKPRTAAALRPLPAPKLAQSGASAVVGS